MSAEISPDGRYRYMLGRRWDRGNPAVFVMLNPSTADAELDDPTIRRCIGFAKREGLGALVVVNLFAYRATKPREMLAAADPVGPMNDTYLREVFAQATAAAVPVIAAWGAGAPPERVAEVVALHALDTARPLRCLGVSAAGHPRHPLYIKGDAPLIDWRAP